LEQSDAFTGLRAGGQGRCFAHKLDPLLLLPRRPCREGTKALNKYCTDRLDRQKDTEADRQTDRQTADRQTDGQTDRQTDFLSHCRPMNNGFHTCTPHGADTRECIPKTRTTLQSHHFPRPPGPQPPGPSYRCGDYRNTKHNRKQNGHEFDRSTPRGPRTLTR